MVHYDYLIAGGGASGLIMAYRMSKDSYFDNKKILIIEKDDKVSNDRTWCYWESGNGEWDHLLSKEWGKIYFGCHPLQLIADISPYRYKMLQSAALYEYLIENIKLNTNFTFLKDYVTNLEEKTDYVLLSTSSGQFSASTVLSSIQDYNPVIEQDTYPYLKQHFVGWFIKTQKPAFDPGVAVFMDFDIPQDGNTRFMYILPFTETKALVEYTLFSEDLLSYESYETEIESYLSSKGITDYQIEEKESGNIPMTGYPFHLHNSARVMYIGSAGGWTKASTGFTFANINRRSKELTQFLKSGNPMTNYWKQSRFSMYDRIFIEVLFKDNALGSKVFSSLFSSTDIIQILRFLNEESTIAEELKIIFSTQPKSAFTVSAFISLYKSIKNKLT